MSVLDTTENIVSRIDLRAASAEEAAGTLGADAVYTGAIAELLDPKAPAETRLARLAAGMVLLQSVSRPGRHAATIYPVLHELVTSAWAEAVDGIDQEQLEEAGLLPDLGGIWLPSDSFGELPVHPAWYPLEDLEEPALSDVLECIPAERAELALAAAAHVAVDLYGTRIWPTAA